MNGKKNTSGPPSKVQRLVDKYDLVALGDELEARWTADTERMSLRELADYFNKTLLESVLREHGMETLSGEPDNIYRVLTDDDVTSGSRIQAENRLRDHGIDVDELYEDFVSRQAIHTYLKKHRGAEYETNSNDRDLADKRLEELQQVRNRLSAVTERAVDSLEKKGIIVLGDFQVLVSVQIQCSDCGKQFDVTRLINRGGCGCAKEE